MSGPVEPGRPTGLPLHLRRHVDYSRHVVDVVTTKEFDTWLNGLRNRQGRLRIIERLDRFAHGSTGDAKSVGGGIYELRMTFGPGYRIYYLEDRETLVLLLLGGDKSTQQTDIRKAALSRTRGSQTSKGSMTTMGAHEKYQRFDAADYLEDLDDVAGYLAIALESSHTDPSALPLALGVMARSQNMSELARKVEMSRDGLYKALSENGNPRWSTLVKVANALDLRFELHSRLTA